jgi:NAD(P)-dependent dehydrogenase (short-subunit alcohol dehydrogenase family)
MNLQGVTALVTGAGKRLGRAIALALAEGGADLVLHVHSSTTAELVAEIQAMGKRLSQDALHDVGPIDVLVNSAAVFYPTPLFNLSVKEWRKVVHVNMTTPLILGMVLGREMKKRGKGKIIQLGDWSGQRPVRSFLPYCVAKGGLHMSTMALAKALAPHVQVNEVVLGPVLPPANYEAHVLQALSAATPLQRLGEPADVLRTVRFLIEAGDFVTGASYVVDGGWLVHPPGEISTSL